MSTAPPFLTPRDDLQALEGYHSPQVDVAIRLNTNESPYPPPQAFLEEWVAVLREVRYHRYPDRAARGLRTALGARLSQSPQRILCANGSNEVLQTLLLTYGGAGRRSAVFEPTYALHAHISRITGTGVVEGERGPDFAVDLGAAAALVDRERPAVTFLCSPNNPTGTVEPRDTVEAVLDRVADGGGLLVVDEAYGEFADWSAIELVDESRPLAVVRTYSKVWSMAAVRLGFCVAPEWMVAELEKVVLPYHLSAPTQLAGTLALRHDDDMRERVARLRSERERVAAALATVERVTAFPSGANFVLFRFDGDGHRLWEVLLDRGVLVRDFSRWPRLAECLRVTIGTPEENDAFLAALCEAVTEVQE